MVSKEADEAEQRGMCRKHHASFLPAPREGKVGIALNVRDGVHPLNGLRHAPDGDTTGWYIWAGTELSDEPDFFQPLHVSHLEQWCPQIKKYLGLAPGWRFLLADGHEDVWFDKTLLEPEEGRTKT